jgi:hypothetical protein
LVSVTTVLAQPAPPDGLSAARTALTGPVAREWVFTQFKIFLGSDKRCQQGEALRFLASGQVEIELCQDKKVTTRTAPWTLQPNGALDPILSFDGMTFLLIFSDRDGKHYMILRQRGASQSDKTVDQEYLLSGG